MDAARPGERIRRGLGRPSRRRLGLLVLGGLTVILGAHFLVGPYVQSLGHEDERVASTIAGPVQGGALVIAGGGKLGDAVRGQFIELAGGSNARIVVIPTGPNADDPDRKAVSLDAWARFKPASLQLLHARTRQIAEEPAFVGPLEEATGVWLGGGNQEWFAAVYGGTPVHRALRDLLERGGVIGGTSAGAAIMSGVAIMGGREDPLEGEGFDLIPGVIIDQHFLKRNRLARLQKMLGRHADLVGLGIDEGTALVVKLRQRQAGVVGDSYVVACVPQESGSPRIEILKPGDHLALDSLRASKAMVTSGLSVDDVISTSALK